MRRSNGATTSSTRAQALFARLAVFAGSFPLEAAEEVCGADLDDLEALVDSSLLKPIGDDRFLMLETIREYARERARGSVEAEALRRRHATFFSALAEQAYEHRFDAEAEWSARLEIDHDDLRAALDWLADERSGASARARGRARLVLVLPRPPRGGATTPGRRDSRGPRRRVVTRARALTAAGALTARAAMSTTGVRCSTRRSLSGASSATEASSRRRSTHSAGCSSTTPETTAGVARGVRAEPRAPPRAGDRVGETRALVGVCQVLVALGEVARAEALSRELLERQPATRAPSTSPTTSSQTAR